MCCSTEALDKTTHLIPKASCLCSTHGRNASGAMCLQIVCVQYTNIKAYNSATRQLHIVQKLKKGSENSEMKLEVKLTKCAAEEEFWSEVERWSEIGKVCRSKQIKHRRKLRSQAVKLGKKRKHFEETHICTPFAYGFPVCCTGNLVFAGSAEFRGASWKWHCYHEVKGRWLN